MRVSDIMKDDDLYDVVFGEDSEKSKKKKKKKKDKGEKKSYKARLKEMSKQELRDRIVSLGINAANINTDSKKEMRNAILEAQGYTLKIAKPKTAADVLEAGPDSKPQDMIPTAKVERVMTERPPHFFDEDGSFVIPDALNASDMTCYEAMESLGAARRTVRPSDGFGEMMDRLTRKLVSEASRPLSLEGQEPIEVEFKDVTDEK